MDSTKQARSSSKGKNKKEGDGGETLLLQDMQQPRRPLHESEDVFVLDEDDDMEWER